MLPITKVEPRRVRCQADAYRPKIPGRVWKQIESLIRAERAGISFDLDIHDLALPKVRQK